MRIRARDTFAGYPIMKVRELLRKWGNGTRVEFVARVMRVSKAKAQCLVDELLASGFIEEARDADGDCGFNATVKGAALAQATASKPLLRSTVEVKLKELVERMVQLNGSHEHLVGVEAAYVYGSYLSDAPTLGDLDVSVTFFRKERAAGERYTELALADARGSGRRFSNFLEKLVWPERKALLFLKQRSRVFSLHTDEPLLEDPTVPRRPIFLARRPAEFETAEGRRR